MSEILRTILYEWKERKLPQVIKRDIALEMQSEPAGNLATVVTGFRRVGKTYLLYQTLNRLLETHSREEVVYINFEDERILSPETDVLTNLIPEIQAVYGKKPRYLFLDELQLIPHWSKWVRRILDSEVVKLVITGSSSKMSSAELPTELRGRALEVKVNPLSLAEFFRFRQEKLDFGKLDFVKDEMARFRFLFNEYLTFGALPAVVLTPQEKKQELLQSYFKTVVQRDIAERHRIENIVALKTLLKMLLNSSYITVSKLHNSLKSVGVPVGKSTITNYLSYVKESYFIDELYIYNQAVKNQLQYPRKVYFVDTGFMTALSTKFSRNLGRLFENIVFHKLSRENEILHYYRDNRGYEVDFACTNEGRLTALYQVCFDLSDSETQERELRSLIRAGRRLQCKNLNLLYFLAPGNFKVPRKVNFIRVDEFLR